MTHLLIDKAIEHFEQYDTKITNFIIDDYDSMNRLFSYIAEYCDGKTYEGYSGRGMYGKECWGIVAEDATKVIEVAGALGIFGAQMDNMGYNSIVYWPDIPYDYVVDESDENDNEIEDDE